MKFPDLTSVLDYFRATKAGAKVVSPAEQPKNLGVYGSVTSLEADAVPTLAASSLRNILDSAATGDCQEQAQLIGNMIEKDSILAAHFATRKMAVMACNQKLSQKDAPFYAPAPQDQRYVDLWNMLQSAGLYELVEHLLDATPQGYSCAVIDWGDGGKIIRGFQPVHPTNIVFDLGGNPALMLRDAREAIPFSDFHPNQFVMHTFGLKPDIPCKNGLGRALAWLFYFKHEARKSWVQFIEKFGIPFLIGKLSDADFEDTTTRTAMATQLRDFARNGAVVAKEEGGVEAVTVAGHHNKIHEEFVRRIDECYALCILGQLGSSQGEPGRLGNNEQQQDVRQDRRESDCRRVMSTINRQIIQPAWLFTYGEAAMPQCPQFMMDFMPPRDRERLASAVNYLAQAGFRPDTLQLSHEIGMSLEESEPIGQISGKPQRGPNAK